MDATDRLQALLSMLESDPEDAFCLYGIAQEYATRGEHAQAIEFYDRAIASDPTDAYAFFHKGRSLQALQRNKDATETLTAGLQVARTQGDLHAESELQGYLQELAEIV